MVVAAGDDFLRSCDQKSFYKLGSCSQWWWRYGSCWIPVNALMWTARHKALYATLMQLAVDVIELEAYLVVSPASPSLSPSMSQQLRSMFHQLQLQFRNSVRGVGGWKVQNVKVFSSRCVKMSFIFSVSEYADVVYSYDFCDVNAVRAAAEYQRRFPNRRIPTRRVFTGFHQTSRDDSTLSSFRITVECEVRWYVPE
jgi:hypothetical protein